MNQSNYSITFDYTYIHKMTSFSGDSCLVSCEYLQLWYHRYAGNILRRGIIPKHVAFIMDGNRTFAKRKSLQTSKIHETGFGKLTEVIQWCLDMGIFEVTAYAFSIENIKRTKEEVAILMNLARDRFKKLIQEWRNLEETGICVRIVGNLTLIPTDLLSLILILMLLTKDNKRICLNIALFYTSKDEMTNTSDLMLNNIKKSLSDNTNISADLLNRCLYTYSSAPLDIIIRTSGQYRLSDFLMWQGAHSYLHITNSLWPNFSAWDFKYAIFCYQHFVNRLAEPLRHHHRLQNRDIYAFGKRIQMYRIHEALKLCEQERQPLDWKKVMSLTKNQLFDYYVRYINSSKDANSK